MVRYGSALTVELSTPPESFILLGLWDGQGSKSATEPARWFPVAGALTCTLQGPAQCPLVPFAPLIAQALGTNSQSSGLHEQRDLSKHVRLSCQWADFWSKRTKV